MKLGTHIRHTFAALCVCAGVSACTYNPLIGNNKTTGSPEGTLLGAGIGAGLGAAANAGELSLLQTSNGLVVLGGLAGGAVGYYVTSVRYAASGIIQAGGQVYLLGDYIGIYLPTDKLFDVNTAHFTEQAGTILASVAAVLERKPQNNIMISGNTSGFAMAKLEQRISEDRAKKVAASLWKYGVTDFKDKGKDLSIRKLHYAGHGDYFPIASTITNKGIRENSRLQITSYPPQKDLRVSGRESTTINVGSNDNSEVRPYDPTNECDMDSGFCKAAFS